MRWLEALAKKPSRGDASVADQMAEAYDASSRGDYARALEIWGPLAQAGVARAQSNIGACFTEGLGVARDLKLGAQWLTLAAAASDNHCNASLGSRSTPSPSVKQAPTLF